jgi:Helix-turn-helix domain of resolvase
MDQSMIRSGKDKKAVRQAERYHDAAWPVAGDDAAGIAEFERELIRARTSDGRARAKARGVHMGRPPKLTPHQRAEAIARRNAGETLVDIARSYNVSHPTISRLR